MKELAQTGKIVILIAGRLRGPQATKMKNPLAAEQLAGSVGLDLHGPYELIYG